jgi:signal transduction histidine kinase
MNLPDFIESRLAQLIAEWEAFAHSRTPATQTMSPEELRDEAKALLLNIAADMRTGQSAEFRSEKSRGVHPAHAPKITGSSMQHARQRLEQGFSLDHLLSEYRALRASVVRLWIEELRDPGREAMDELVRFDEALDQSITEAVAWYSQKLEESRNLFLGVLGHDLRNPLGAIQGSAYYLLRKERLDGAQTKAVTRIVNSSARMEQMVSDLLDFTRTRLGRGLPIMPAAADLCEVCRQVVDELGAFHPERSLLLDCTGDLSGSWDTARIGQMLSNLVANAVQHGEPHMPITINARADGDHVVVEVHNEGPPIAPEAQETIFQPLMRGRAQQTKRRERTSGLGLGLYISHQIALAHRGSIAVASSEKDGTTFIVRLPRRPQPS